MALLITFRPCFSDNIMLRDYQVYSTYLYYMLLTSGWEDPPKEEMATYSSILAWEIAWTEAPGGLQSTGLQRQTRLSGSMQSYILFAYSVSLCMSVDIHILICMYNMQIMFLRWVVLKYLKYKTNIKLKFKNKN